jgi:hypothetical protein
MATDQRHLRITYRTLRRRSFASADEATERRQCLFQQMSLVLLAPRSTQFSDTRHRRPQIGDQSVGDGVAPAVYGYVRALLPGL